MIFFLFSCRLIEKLQDRRRAPKTQVLYLTSIIKLCQFLELEPSLGRRFGVSQIAIKTVINACRDIMHSLGRAVRVHEKHLQSQIRGKALLFGCNTSTASYYLIILQLDQSKPDLNTNGTEKSVFAQWQLRGTQDTNRVCGWRFMTDYCKVQLTKGLSISQTNSFHLKCSCFLIVHHKLQKDTYILLLF